MPRQDKRNAQVDVMVGRRIRIRRLELNMSQSALAEKLSVTFQQVQKYEKGTNGARSSRLAQICSALNVPITYFFQEVKLPGNLKPGSTIDNPAFALACGSDDARAILMMTQTLMQKKPAAVRALRSSAEMMM